jgi:hypothetical protein
MIALAGSQVGGRNVCCLNSAAGIVGDGAVVASKRATLVSPEVGIVRCCRRRHLSAVIRKAGLEWAARRQNSQGAIHSAFWSISRPPRNQPGRFQDRSGRAFLQPWTASGEALS